MARLFSSSALLGLLLVGCIPAGPAPVVEVGSAPVVLRSYAVGSHGGQAVNVLQSAFRGDAVNARVVAGPSGEVIVVASEDVQVGVEQFLDGLDSVPSGAPPNVELTYWVLSGRAGEGARPAIPMIAPALDAIEARSGKMDFTVVSGTSLISRSGDWAESSATHGLNVNQSASVNPSDDSIVAKVTIGIPGKSRIETQIALKDAQVAVLAEVGAEAGSSFYYVIGGAVR